MQQNPHSDILVEGVYTADSFVAEINEKIAEILTRRHEPPESYAFNRKIDFVIIGPCSDGYLTSPIPGIAGVIAYASTVFGPLKDSEGWWSGARADYFAQYLKEDERSTVVLISCCCRQYSPAMQKALQEHYPLVEWVFPKQSDYCSFPRASVIANDFLQPETNLFNAV